MLQLEIPDGEFYNEKTEEFVTIKGTTLQLEHSLMSLSKWESEWKIPFLSTEDKTIDQIVDYIRCMTINHNVDPKIYDNLSGSIIDEVNLYIENPMTATWFNDIDNRRDREVVTAEIIYYWMILHNIPFECQKWHLNKLLTLIRVCSIKNAPEKKMSRRETINLNRKLNNQRRSKMNSKG